MRFTIFILLASSISASSWTYADRLTWGDTAGNAYAACGTTSTAATVKQSPIDIVRSSLVIPTTTTDIEGSYNTVSDLKIKNDGGHTLKVAGAFGTTTYNSKDYS